MAQIKRAQRDLLIGTTCTMVGATVDEQREENRRAVQCRLAKQRHAGNTFTDRLFPFPLAEDNHCDYLKCDQTRDGKVTSYDKE